MVNEYLREYQSDAISEFRSIINTWQETVASEHGRIGNRLGTALPWADDVTEGLG